MLPFAESYVSWLLATSIPTFLGMVLIVLAGKRLKAKYVAGFALGIFLWFFLDTMNDASDLYVGVDSVEQFAVVVLFIAGLLLFSYLDKGAQSTSVERAASLTIPILAAIAIGVHGFGEGTAFGSTAYNSSASVGILDAFGGLAAGTGYVLHKALESMMVGALYVSLAVQPGDRVLATGGKLRWSSSRLTDILLLTAFFIIPSAIGAATGYFAAYDATYFYALGAGTSVFVALGLARVALQTSGQPRPGDGLRVAVALLVGFILIYAAAQFH